jgi:cytochrome c biogenesis protein CcdA
MIKKIVSILFVCLLFMQTAQAIEINQITEDTAEHVQPHQKTDIIVFVRDGCGNCAKEEKFLNSNEEIQNNFNVQLLDIGEDQNKEMWQTVTEKYKLSKVTPITLVGGDVLVGFNEKITTKKILNAQNKAEHYDVNFYLENDVNADDSGSEYACTVESASTCSLDQGNTGESAESMMTLPFFGEIDIKETSLFVMSAVLGFIDGFNPCAMWVLLTFLIILSQIGDKRKMIYLVGVFIFAEAIMYFFILNVWYQTWDFIALDGWVTPAVGLLAIGSGIYFLYKWNKSKGELTCDVTSFEHQQKTTQKIKDVVSKPITIITTLAVLAIAFSVNIIEFACSVGIAQSFTKILELNDLSFIGRQFYIFIYTLFYMADDFLIFGLAIFGFEKFHTVGAKYSHLSMLIGGILMLILGFMLVFMPEMLMFG